MKRRVVGQRAGNRAQTLGAWHEFQKEGMRMRSWFRRRAACVVLRGQSVAWGAIEGIFCLFPGKEHQRCLLRY